MHSVRFLFLPMVLSLLLSGCAQTRETSSTIFAMNTVMELTEMCIRDSLYSELLTDFERIGDHVLNIAQEMSSIREHS